MTKKMDRFRNFGPLTVYYFLNLKIQDETSYSLFTPGSPHDLKKTLIPNFHDNFNQLQQALFV